MIKRITLWIIALVPFLCYAQQKEIYEDSVIFTKSKVGDYMEFVKAVPAARSGAAYEVTLGLSRNARQTVTYFSKLAQAKANLWEEAIRLNAHAHQLLAGANYVIDCNTGPKDVRFRIRAAAINYFDTTVKIYIKIIPHGRNQQWQPLKQKGNEPAKIKSLKIAYQYFEPDRNYFTRAGFSQSAEALTDRSSKNA